MAAAIIHEHAPFEATQIWSIDLRELLDILESQGRMIYGSGFSLIQDDIPVIASLFSYFLADPEQSRRYNLNQSKGILLSGPVGCGKTSLMFLVRYFMAPERKFTLKACRDISFEFHSKGFSTIGKYSQKRITKVNDQIVPWAYCFDGLGQELKVNFYGNECEPMKEIILCSYEQFESNGMITHFTTHLNLEQLEARYGHHVVSRLLAMSNLIAFDQSTQDKRRIK